MLIKFVLPERWVEFIGENGGGPVYGCERDNKGTARSPPFLV
jgi:hypothetical protein